MHLIPAPSEPEPLFKLNPEAIDAATRIANFAARSKHVAEVESAYAEMVQSAIQTAFQRRIRMIEDHRPEEETFYRFSLKEVNPSGVTRFSWRGEPLIEFHPPQFGVDGAWLDAQIIDLVARAES